MTTLLAPSTTPRSRSARHTFSAVLLQVRDRDSALLHEQLCFLERLGVPPERLRCINVLASPVPRLADLAGADLVMVGGAGAHSAYENYEFTAPLCDLMLGLIDASVPFFGSCFGHQLMARALGGDVVFDPAGEEVGTFDVDLTEAGRADPLFEGFPARFPVQLGHHDRVSRLPAGVSVLAASERCSCQVIRVPGKPAYGTQFHCEMSADHMRERLLMYQQEYMPGEDALAVLDSVLRPTALVEGLLGRFVDLYC